VLRGLLIAQRDDCMQHWRIGGHVYPFEAALKSGADVVVSSGRLAVALDHAGHAAGRFDAVGADAGQAGGACVVGAAARLLARRLAV
jgi:hypothetical protein